MSDFEKLNIVLAARDQQFARAMDRNTRRIERFTRQSNKNLKSTTSSFSLMAAAGKRLGPVMAALGAGAVIGQLKRTVATLDDIGKTADKLGITTDALQEFRAVAESAGVSQGMLDSSLERFSKRLGEANLGMGAARKTLKELGLEASDLADIGLEDALGIVADKMAAISDPTERAARAAALFGREGVAMVTLMAQGAAGMDKMRAEANALGIVIDEKLIRNAEGAQTQLDLMSRVISAQLNSALIELAPLLVGGATAIADMARGLASAASWISETVKPTSELEKVTENLVSAMGDEIRQSQLLETALGNGINMSVGAARAKLQEAKGRYQNVNAIIAEHRALALQSTEYADLTQQIEGSQALLNATGFPTNDIAVPRHAEAFEAEQLSLANLLVRRGELLKQDKEMIAQQERSAANIEKLEAGIAGAQGGVVDIKGTYVVPIENSPKAEIKSTGSAAGAAIPELSNYADVIDRIRSVFGAGKTAGDDYASTLAQVDALYRDGKLTGDEYADAVGQIEEKFKDTKAAAEALEDAATQTLVSILTRSKSAKDAVGDLLGQLSQMAAKAAFSGLLGGIFNSVAPIFTPGASLVPSAAAAGFSGVASAASPTVGFSGALSATRSAAAQTGASKALEINVNVSGARGNKEVQDMVREGVSMGLDQFDRHVLPVRVNQIGRDPKKVG